MNDSASAVVPVLTHLSMLGDRLLVAPVFSDDTALVYIPAGKWTWYAQCSSFR